MSLHSVRHLSDALLLSNLQGLVARDRTTTAALLAHIAEVDARRLYASAGYTSMYAYCVEELRLSEDAAYKRILAARAARQFPAVFALVAEGRLHLTAVRLLAPHLTSENVDELLTAASDLRKSELELLLARRFPRTADFATLRPIVAEASPSLQTELPAVDFVPGPAAQQVPGPVEATGPSPDAPAPSGRFLLKVVLDESTREKLWHARALLSHAVPSGDIAQVLDRALDALIARFERQKFAKAARPRTRPRVELASTIRGRFVPAGVRRAVWERDAGRCTFVGTGGHRCHARRFLEFDHVEPFARGGQPTIEGMRLRCRTHNRVEAERAFGVDFMTRKRGSAPRAQARERRTAVSALDSPPSAAENRSRDLSAGLRGLGPGAGEAARANRAAQIPPGAPLEVQLRAALESLRPAAVLPSPRR